ncbi:MAG: PHP domain-containing protein [Clostridioides sp.]|jgi:putative hydrolase|nr:PHP domain-containing protein [Clostridioides sp.]
MKILADYHTHTVFSHGKGSIEDNVRVAIEKGIPKIGIADHGYRHLTYGVKYKDIPRMREEVDRLNEKYPEIEIILGMECNILDDRGNIDIDDKIRGYLDYVMAGYHFGSMPTSFRGAYNHFENYTYKGERARAYNTRAVVNAMKNNDIFVITHPGDKGEVDIEEVAKEAIQTDTKLEINSSHSFLNIEQLKIILSTCTYSDLVNRFIMGSDAHISRRVGDFNLALENASKAGLDINTIANITE